MEYDPDSIVANPHLHHPKHVAIALINIGIRDRGEKWTKCIECGDAYQLIGEATEPFCDKECEREHSDAMKRGGFF